MKAAFLRFLKTKRRRKSLEMTTGGFRMKGKGFFITLLISNCIIFLVAAAAVGVNFLGYRSSTLQYVNDYNTVFLRQIRNVMDERVLSANRIAVNIAKNNDISSNIYSRRPFEENDRLNSINAMNSLENFSVVYAYIDSILVYYEDSDMMVTNETVYYTLDDFLSGSDHSYWTRDELKSLLERDEYFSYQTSQTGDDPLFTVVYRPKLSELHRYYIILNLDYSSLETFGENKDFFSGGLLMARNQDGETMFTLGDSKYLTDPQYSMISEVPVGSQEISSTISVNGEHIMAIKILSVESDWSYYFVIPEDLFVRYAENLLIFTIVFLLLVFALILAAVFAKLNVLPLRKTLAHINSVMGGVGTVSEKGNEFELIGKAMTKSVEEYQKLQGRMASQIPILQMHSIQELLSGNFSDDPDYLRSIGISFPHSQYRAILFNLDFSLMPETEGIWLLTAKFQSLLQQDGGDRFSVYTTDVDSNHTIAAVLNFVPGDNPPWEKELYSALLSSFQNEQIVITAAVGSMAASIQELPQSYSSAQKALQQRLLRAPGGMAYAEKGMETQNEYYYSLDLESQLIQSIKSGKIDNVFSIIDSIIMENFVQNHISLESAKCLMFSMMGTAYRVVAGIGRKDFSVSQSEMYQKILSCTNLQEVEVMIRQLYVELCSHINAERKLKSAKIIDQIINYINANYSDSNISLSSAAAEVGLNQNYLSGYFKEQTGENFQVYLNRVRLEASKKFLEDPRISVGDVAQRVGYSNGSVYIRNFKKMYGVTPGQYRDSLS